MPSMTTITYTVPGVHCGHCEHAIKTSVSAVAGVESVDVDLETKLVDRPRRRALDDAPPRRDRRRRLRGRVTPSRRAERVDLDIEGMTCASCAARIERKLNRLDGVEATVNFATEQAAVDVRPGARARSTTLVAAVEAAGYRRALAAREAARPRATTPARAPPAARRRGRADRAARRCSRWCRRCSSTAGSGSRSRSRRRSSSGAAGRSTAPRSLNARHGAATMDTLISLGTLAACGWSAVVARRRARRATPTSRSARVITTLILLGRFLEARARRRSGEAIRALLELGAKEARVLRDGEEVLVPVAELVVGDRFVVRPGEKIATDGVVEEGASAVDQSMLTGESVPGRGRARAPRSPARRSTPTAGSSSARRGSAPTRRSRRSPGSSPRRRRARRRSSGSSTASRPSSSRS